MRQVCHMVVRICVLTVHHVHRSLSLKKFKKIVWFEFALARQVRVVNCLSIRDRERERKKEKERERKRLKLRYVFLLHFSNEMTYLFSVFSDLEADGACRRTTRTGFL